MALLLLLRLVEVDLFECRKVDAIMVWTERGRMVSVRWCREESARRREKNAELSCCLRGCSDIVIIAKVSAEVEHVISRGLSAKIQSSAKG